MTNPADDDATPVGPGAHELMLIDALKIRDAVIVRAQQHHARNDDARAKICFDFAKDIQILVDAAREYPRLKPTIEDYVEDSKLLEKLRAKALGLGVPL